jgi:hypothetical protein
MASVKLHSTLPWLPEHRVIDEARTAKRPGKNHFLLGRWVEPESVCTLDVHGATMPRIFFETINRSTETTPKPALLPSRTQGTLQQKDSVFSPARGGVSLHGCRSSEQYRYGTNAAPLK